jgi:hypothetical protein
MFRHETWRISRAEWGENRPQLLPLHIIILQNEQRLGPLVPTADPAVATQRRPPRCAAPGAIELPFGRGDRERCPAVETFNDGGAAWHGDGPRVRARRR